MSADRGWHVRRRRCRARRLAHQDEASPRQVPDQILGGDARHGGDGGRGGGTTRLILIAIATSKPSQKRRVTSPDTKSKFGSETEKSAGSVINLATTA
jgi:hypothetical protein